MLLQCNLFICVNTPLSSHPVSVEQLMHEQLFARTGFVFYGVAPLTSDAG